MDINGSIDQALALHQAGRLPEAAALYRQILVAAPVLADVHYLLGMACLGQGETAAAVKALRHAVRMKPDRGDWWFNLGVALRQTSDVDAAMEAFASAAARSEGQPQAQADAMAERGALLMQAGDMEGGETTLRRALTLIPGHMAASRNLAALLVNRFAEASSLHRDDAVRVLTEATQLAPRLAEAWVRLGRALLVAERLTEALPAFDAALKLAPGDLYAMLGRADALTALGRLEEADGAARAVAQSFPEEASALVALAGAAHAGGRLTEAVDALRRALVLAPDDLAAIINLGTVLRDLGDDAGAEAQYRRALALAPDMPVIHWQRAQARLLAGDLAEGWREYEWRWRMAGFPLSDALKALPVWDGGALPADKGPLLVHAEQGHGDSLQFVRYVPLLLARHIQVLLQVQPALVRLFRESLPPEVEVAALGAPVPPTVRQRCPLLGLPLRLGTLSVEAIPAPVPYLKAEEGRRSFWRDRLRTLPGRHVGLVWAGDARTNDPRAAATNKRRSMALSQLALLGTVPGVSFVSLQKGPCAAELTQAPFHISDWTADLGDFADTAALVAELDIVITVDTAVAHLAGGLGCPVWVLSRFDGCWRWLRQRTDNPWYRDLRLFRQTTWGDWTPVIVDLVDQFSDWAEERIEEGL